jgi:hypothetical protein
MGETGPRPSSARRAKLVPRLGVAAVVLIAYYVGTLRPNIAVHTGTGFSAESAVSVEVDGWTYSVPRDDITWIDHLGAWHDSGRPACLPVGETVTVTFGAVGVTKDGSTWRQVVWVDCR